MLLRKTLHALISLQLLMAAGISAHAQEAVRSSLAGESAAAAAPTQSFDDHYNVKMGPVLFNMSAGTSFSYNDNINLSETNKKSDFIITPNVGINAHWPVTSINSLNLTLGLGYSKYMDNSSVDTQWVNISPDSRLDFIVFMGDFKFTFYDSFYFQQNPVDEIALANVSTFSRISNTVGVDVDWDLNDVVLSLGYSHTDFMPTSSQFKYTGSTTDTLTQRTAFTVNPTLTVGLSNSIAYTRYDDQFLNNNWNFMSGPFANIQLSPYVSLSATAGLQYLDASSNGAVGDTSGGTTSWYGSLSLSHRINNYISQAITLSHTNPVGLNSDYVELSSLQHSASWQIIRNVSLGTNLFIEYGQESGGILAEDVWRYGGGVSASYNLTRKLTTTLSYTHTERDSDVYLRDYSQNVVTLNLNYQF